MGMARGGMFGNTAIQEVATVHRVLVMHYFGERNIKRQFSLSCSFETFFEALVLIGIFVIQAAEEFFLN